MPKYKKTSQMSNLPKEPPNETMKLFIPNALWLPPACSWYMSSKSASNGVNAALTPPSIITMPINKNIK